MTPSTDERIASVIRALTEVILPHLPADALLAQEQVQLSIGHLQILRLQLDGIAGFEAEELADIVRLATELVESIEGGPGTRRAVSALKAALDRHDGDSRARLSQVNMAIERLVQAASVDGHPRAKGQLAAIILRHEQARAEKDRRWFLPYGFDTMDAS